MQSIRRKNFQYLRELMRGGACLEPLDFSAGVRAHGMHMFAIRYRQEHCGELSLGKFLELVQAEGAPIYRAYAVIISDQPAIQNSASVLQFHGCHTGAVQATGKSLSFLRIFFSHRWRYGGHCRSH